MPSTEAMRLTELLNKKVKDFKDVCADIDEETAARAPSGRWSPKEIVSHLCGPEGIGLLPTFSAFVEKDVPRLDIEAEDSFFSENRARATFADLIEEFEAEYSRIAEFTAGLSDEQLSRKAHIPMLKESPIGEYPTLSGWIQVIGEHHLAMHGDHMREILEALGAGSGPPTRQMNPGAHAVPPSGM
jgi:hypothetical protein